MIPRGLAAAGALLLVAVAGSGLYTSSVESATVKISLPAWKLDSWAELRGAPSGAQFQTARLQVSLTETASGTATGTARSAATYATGYVVFSFACPYLNPGCTPAPAKPGYEVCRINPTGGAWCYVLQTTVTCFCGERVPVKARGPGSTFNTAANTVTTPTGWNGGVVLTVTNPEPISGGSDGGSYQVVSQSNIDSLKARMITQMSTDLGAALQTKAGPMHLIPDSEPSITVSPSVAAGSRSATFAITATGALSATAFLDSDAKALIAKGLDRWVPKGYRLDAAPVVDAYRVEASDAQGDVTVAGIAAGRLVAAFSIDSLKSRLAGRTVGAARDAIEAVAPGSEVEIRFAPLPGAVLPLNVARISISVESIVIA